MINKQDLLSQRELIQDDIICILDGSEQKTIDKVCQVVVDRFEILLNQTEDSIEYDSENLLGWLMTKVILEVKDGKIREIREEKCVFFHPGKPEGFINCCICKTRINVCLNCLLRIKPDYVCVGCSRG